MRKTESVGVGIEERRDLFRSFPHEIRGGEAELGVERRTASVVGGLRKREVVDDPAMHRVHTILMDRFDMGIDWERGDLWFRPPDEVEVGNIEGGASTGWIMPCK